MELFTNSFLITRATAREITKGYWCMVWVMTPPLARALLFFLTKEPKALLILAVRGAKRHILIADH